MPQLLTSLDNFPPDYQQGAVAVGNFDGVHRGHAQLIGELVATARRLGGPALVMTFDPPPIAVLHPERRLDPPLTSIQRRCELLCKLGVDALLAYPTDGALLALSAEAFFRRIIVGMLGARAMIEGPNFRFGYQRAGDTRLLHSLCSEAGVDFSIAVSSEDSAGMISSTRIREVLARGDVAAANTLLTEHYSVDGTVVRGAQRGREIGFPTANLELTDSLIPGAGVYAAWVRALDDPNLLSIPQLAAVNIGPNPTFAETRTKFEVHLLKYAGPPLYGNRLRISLIDKIRDVQKFDSLEDLRVQITRDIAACAKFGLAAPN